MMWINYEISLHSILISLRESDPLKNCFKFQSNCTPYYHFWKNWFCESNVSGNWAIELICLIVGTKDEEYYSHNLKCWWQNLHLLHWDYQIFVKVEWIMGTFLFKWRKKIIVSSMICEFEETSWILHRWEMEMHMQVQHLSLSLFSDSSTRNSSFPTSLTTYVCPTQKTTRKCNFYSYLHMLWPRRTEITHLCN